jgi:hypothetical protein
VGKWSLITWTATTKDRQKKGKQDMGRKMVVLSGTWIAQASGPKPFPFLHACVLQGHILLFDLPPDSSLGEQVFFNFFFFETIPFFVSIYICGIPHAVPSRAG